MQILPSNIINYMKIKVGVINFFSKNKRIIIPLIIALFYILFYFLVDFSTQSLVAHDEGLYARRARLIEYSDNWFSPPFSSPHHKTLGSYWFIALAIRLFGNSELALRLPSIIASFFCLISSYLIALKITNKKSALISVFSLSSMPLWIQYSRYASPDILFVLCILLVILFFLKFLDSPQFYKQYFYILVSGFFISTSFFIRSYMAFVPLIGLSPFILYNLIKQRDIFKILFFTGIFIGSIPTLFNLYFSYKKFGIFGITTLFDFARKQALGDFGFNNLILIPLNFLYLTFPIGILFLILFIFTKPKNNISYPLLIYYYPLISLVILLCMSTSYPHYFLFLLPSLSILFSVILSSNSSRFFISRISIKYLLLMLITLISFVLLFFVINYNNFIVEYSYGNTSLVYILSSFLLISYITSIRFIFDIRFLEFDLINFFYNIVIPQYISLSLLFNFGILGNPNSNIKLFLRDEVVSPIISSNTIYLFSVDSKIQTLLSYYLPSSQVVRNAEDLTKYKYLITSDINSLNTLKIKSLFKSIKKSDNQFLLVNISK